MYFYAFRKVVILRKQGSVRSAITSPTSASNSVLALNMAFFMLRVNVQLNLMAV